jgi:hypothetical protein
MRTAFAMLGLLLVAGLISCSAPVRNYACATEPGGTHVDAAAAWSCNRDVLRRAAKQKAFSMREFESAARFFEQLTGIELDTRESHLGQRLPGPRLWRDLQDLDAWYELHGASLRWDPARGEVVVDRLAPS